MTQLKDSELREKLADIEHQRWADWQNWVHKVYLEGNFGEFMLRWQKQIATQYKDLTEKEKQSDRDQVDRYWHLVEEYIATHTNQLIDELLSELPTKASVPAGNLTSAGTQVRFRALGFNQAISEVTAILEKKKGVYDKQRTP